MLSVTAHPAVMAVSGASGPLQQNFVYVPAVADIMDFHGVRGFIDSINDSVTLGAKRQVSRQLALKTLPVSYCTSISIALLTD